MKNKSFILKCDNQKMDGRPCWMQKVENSDSLFILSQSVKPEEKNFPYVQSMLAEIVNGEIKQYGSDEILGLVTDFTIENENLKGIKWIDGTDVLWVEI